MTMNEMEHSFSLVSLRRVLDTKIHELQSVTCECPTSTMKEGVLRFMGPTIRWVATCNPAMPGLPAGSGLNMYGVTVLRQSGAAAMGRLMSGWKCVLLVAPESIDLPQGFDVESGAYAYHSFDRDELIESCESLSSLCEQAAADERLCVLHLGL